MHVLYMSEEISSSTQQFAGNRMILIVSSAVGAITLVTILYVAKPLNRGHSSLAIIQTLIYSKTSQ